MATAERAAAEAARQFNGDQMMARDKNERPPALSFPIRHDGPASDLRIAVGGLAQIAQDLAEEDRDIILTRLRDCQALLRICKRGFESKKVHAKTDDILSRLEDMILDTEQADFSEDPKDHEVEI